ncbi:hypothetical protein [Mesorhizobium marinum]
MIAMIFAAGAASVLAGCQTTSDAGSYKPANCAMVGSRCSHG